MTPPCDCPPNAYFYSVYTNTRICRTHWTEENATLEVGK